MSRTAAIPASVKAAPTADLLSLVGTMRPGDPNWAVKLRDRDTESLESFSRDALTERV